MGESFCIHLVFWLTFKTFNFMKIIKPSIEKLTLNENTILRQNGNYFQFIVLLTLLSPRIIVNFIRVTTAH